MKVLNTTKGTLLADKAIFAEILWKRLVGLLGRKGLCRGEALVIRPCSGIHTFFMRFPIDVIFLDRDSRVRKVIRGMQPFRLSSLVLGAREAVELPSGVVASTRTEAGDLIEFQQSQ